MVPGRSWNVASLHASMSAIHISANPPNKTVTCHDQVRHVVDSAHHPPDAYPVPDPPCLLPSLDRIAYLSLKFLLLKPQNLSSHLLPPEH